MTWTDERLLDALDSALAPSAAEPTHAELHDLRVAVARASRPAVAAVDGRRRGRVRAVTALAASVVAVLGTGVVAAAAGVGLPGPVRSAAVAVGLPVDDARVAEAKADLARLRGAVASGSVDRVRVAAASMHDCLAKLSAADRAKVADEADALLAEADRLIAAPAAPVVTTTPTTTAAAGPVTATTAPAPRSTTTTTAAAAVSAGSNDGSDDHGGDSTTTTSPTATSPTTSPSTTTTSIDQSGGDGGFSGSGFSGSGSGTSGSSGSDG